MGKPLAAVCIAVLSLTGCVRITPIATDPRGVLRFTGTPPDAHIEIDDKSLGPLHLFEKDGVLLRPGRHRIIASADHYFTEYLTVELEAGQTVVLEIELRPVPD